MRGPTLQNVGRRVRHALKQVSKCNWFDNKVSRHLCSQRAGYIYYFPKTSPSDMPEMPELTTVDSPTVFGVKSYSKESQRRPESKRGSNPQQVYTEVETTRYTDKPRNVRTQADMTRMAIEIISRSVEKKTDLSTMLILDIGCGSGLNLKPISASSCVKHFILGVDINRHMLNKALDIGKETDAVSPRLSTCFDLVQGDLRRLDCVRKGVMDAVISISVIQWLLTETERSFDFQSFRDFLTSITHCMKTRAPAVCQFYPSDPLDLVRIVNIVTEVDAFHGALICGFPHENKAKKLFLFLQKK